MHAVRQRVGVRRSLSNIDSMYSTEDSLCIDIIILFGDQITAHNTAWTNRSQIAYRIGAVLWAHAGSCLYASIVVRSTTNDVRTHQEMR